MTVATQNDEGLWYVLKNRTYDDGAGTLTCTTSRADGQTITQSWGDFTVDPATFYSVSLTRGAPPSQPAASR